MEIEVIELDVALEVEYEVVIDPPACRHYPIDIVTAKLRGKDVLSLLHIGHIMTLQRRIHNRLLDRGEMHLPANALGIEGIG